MFHEYMFGVECLVGKKCRTLDNSISDEYIATEELLPTTTDNSIYSSMIHNFT